MDAEAPSRADLALPEPREQAGSPEEELLEAAAPESAPREKPPAAPPRPTWSSLLKTELEFLGVTQILVGFLCLCFGVIVHFVLDNSEFDREILSSFNTGYPFWGAILFIVSGALSVLSERKSAVCLARGRLGANSLGSVAAALGIVLLVLNLGSSSAAIRDCETRDADDSCLVASFTTEIVAMMLLLTVLGFCAAALLTIYGLREECQRSRVPDERLYEELNIYTPIYSELENKEESSSRVDS